MRGPAGASRKPYPPDTAGALRPGRAPAPGQAVRRRRMCARACASRAPSRSAGPAGIRSRTACPRTWTSPVRPSPPAGDRGSRTATFPYGASPAAARAEPPSGRKWPVCRFSSAAFSAGSSTSGHGTAAEERRGGSSGRRARGRSRRPRSARLGVRLDGWPAGWPRPAGYAKCSGWTQGGSPGGPLTASRPKSCPDGPCCHSSGSLGASQGWISITGRPDRRAVRCRGRAAGRRPGCRSPCAAARLRPSGAGTGRRARR